MEHREMTKQIIGCAYTVYNKMGFGFLTRAIPSVSSLPTCLWKTASSLNSSQYGGLSGLTKYSWSTI